MRKCLDLGTPLRKAAKDGEPGAFRMLPDGGSDVNELDSRGQMACRKRKSQEIMLHWKYYAGRQKSTWGEIPNTVGLATKWIALNRREALHGVHAIMVKATFRLVAEMSLQLIPIDVACQRHLSIATSVWTRVGGSRRIT